MLTHVSQEPRPEPREENDRDIIQTSRLIVKNLPKYVDSERLKEHFGSHGEVTDCKVMRTRDGHSRCFGFVGFASSEDAAAARRYYNKSFMDATRLEVDFAQKYGAEAKKNAWSKYTEGTSRYKEHQKAATGANAVEVVKKSEKKDMHVEDDPKLQEFLALMQPRHKKAIWSNDDIIEGGNDVKTVDGQQKGVVFDQVDNNESEDEYEEIVEARGDEMVQDQEDVAVDEVVVNKDVSDLDYLKSRMTKAFSDEEEDGDDDDDDGEEREEEKPHTADREVKHGRGMEEPDTDDTPEHDKQKNNDQKIPIEKMDVQKVGEDDPENLIRQTARLFLRNLPYSANEDDIRSFLESHGELENVHIIVDKSTRKSKGYALVTFMESEDAVRAFNELDGSIFMGRLLHMIPGKAAPRQEDGLDPESNGPTSSYKKDKEVKMKQEEATNKVAWNTLFMRSDTVAEAVADMYNMSKSDLLDPSASDMAVRLALGEVKVINMTKEYLEEHGVRVDLLEAAAQASGKGTTGKVKRSDCILIIKNLPFALDEEELKSMFTDMGTVLRWILPPSHTLAFVEFSSNQDASRAFKSLTFKRYKSVPIYLEWAPRDIFDHSKKDMKKIDRIEKKPEKKEISAAISSLKDSVADADSSTIFVKNLAFKTKKKSFENHFENVVQECGGEMKSAKIAQRTKDGKQVSAGFGFVECSSETVAKDVIQKLQGSSLDGHNLILQIAQPNLGTEKQEKRDIHAMKQASTKVLIRNLAFEATRQDIMNLFTALAEVKSCRLPKKFDGSHRGFAFIEFASAGEAKTAMNAISGTHLYGRRLVLEWAADQEESEENPSKPNKKQRVSSY